MVYYNYLIIICFIINRFLNLLLEQTLSYPLFCAFGGVDSSSNHLMLHTVYIRAHFKQKDGGRMKVLAGHHWSPQTIMSVAILGILTASAVIGLLLGMVLGNIGAGISLGIFGGLIISVVFGLYYSEHFE